MRFEFATTARIVFGAGTLREIGPIAVELGRRPLIVTGRDPARAQRLVHLLSAARLVTTTFAIPGEPTTDDIVQGAAHARSAGCDFVIGFGGGSALDSAKAIAALLTNHGDIHDYLEVIGQAQPLLHAAAPCISIPTTAGTGAEVTRNAVLLSPSHRTKVSLRSAHMLPRMALIDPELTYDLPPSVTASTGLDALTQLIEPYVSARANPLTDAICVEGISRVARSLSRAVKNGRDVAAREDMSIAGLFGGLALANAGLGAVHGFAGPIGGMFSAPHGAVCATLLPKVMTANLQALRSRTPSHDSLRRYHEIARVVTGRSEAMAEEGIAWVAALVASLQIPSLRTYGIIHSDIPAIVQASAQASSMKANPIVLTATELASVLEQDLASLPA